MIKVPLLFAISWMELALKSSKETNRFLMGLYGLFLENRTWYGQNPGLTFIPLKILFPVDLYRHIPELARRRALM